MKAHLFERLIPLDRASRSLLRAVRPIERTERVRLEVAIGRVASENVRAPFPVPAFPRATWDGYAVRSRDVRRAGRSTPLRLRVVGEVFAEQTYPGRMGPGEAVAIATGGALPSGADAIEIFENVRRRAGQVELRAPVRRGARIAPAGDDFARGALLVERGTPLGPADLGALAASGFPTVRVFARPTVAIVPNGNELRPPGGRLGRGQIFESNNAALSAFVRACGGEPRPVEPVPDDPAAIERALRRAVRTSDMVLSTGGSSVGERDHLPRIFPKIGTLLFHGIAVRPGKPTLAATARGTLLVGLPGHPTSCLLNMHWLVMPALRRLARLPGPGWTVRSVRLTAEPAAPSPGLATVVPLRVEGDRATPTFRGSSAISSLRRANGFAFLPPGRRSLRPGDRLRARLLDPPLGAATTD